MKMDEMVFGPQSSPWLSIWLKPRDTIARIVVDRPTRHVLLLAALGAIALACMQLIEFGYVRLLLDWRILGAVILFGAIQGIVLLYLYALPFKWAGAIFGGHATARSLRAVLAWSLAPYLLGFLVYLAALIALPLAGTAPGPSRALPEVVVVATILWSLVMMFVMLARVQQFGFWRTLAVGGVGWLSGYILLAFLPSLLIRTFLFQPFNIPSGAMMPTLLVGDYFFVSKFSYGYSRFSLPWSPELWKGRVLASEPQRGDVVVFRLPKDNATDYVKRVVGLPGDRIQVTDGHLHINGQPVERERIEEFVDEEPGKTIRVKQWRETLPNGVSYNTLDLTDNGFLDNTQVYVVPPGHYFMMGDNRDNTVDSRVLSQVGYVPFENLVGRVRIIYMSVEREKTPDVTRVRSDRFGLIVR